MAPFFNKDDDKLHFSAHAHHQPGMRVIERFCTRDAGEPLNAQRKVARHDDIATFSRDDGRRQLIIDFADAYQTKAETASPFGALPPSFDASVTPPRELISMRRRA